MMRDYAKPKRPCMGSTIATSSDRAAQRQAERSAKGKPIRRISGEWLRDPNRPKWRLQSDNDLRSGVER